MSTRGPRVCPEKTVDAPSDLASLSSILGDLERERELRWKRFKRATELKLRWRALFTQKRLHILPGECILELGSGGGSFSAHLDRILRSENPITGAVFSSELLVTATSRKLGNVSFVAANEYLENAPSESFDFLIGSGMLWHPRFSETLHHVFRLLKPGGQILFFEPNLRLPARLLNELARRRADRVFHAGFNETFEIVSRSGFLDTNLVPHDIVSCRLGYRLMERIQAKAVLVEHMPGLRIACASMCLNARKPGIRERPTPNLAEHHELYGAVSVVVPAHNEAPNIEPLIRNLLGFYGDYIHEIVIVNDNSTDRTADAVRQAAVLDPRVRLVDRRPPNGVGRALRDGYRAATGKYILSMDCDFVEILPEFRGLFDAVAGGHEGAIGSRFSHDSVLLNYPFLKMFFNRACHWLIKLFLFDRVRDISNNLKLYRADILRGMEIESPHFAANLETGLKPLLAGRDITEVPISWINRTPHMGSSTFHLREVCRDYARALYRCWHSRHSASGSIAAILRGALTRLGRMTGHSAQ
jgi:dolichol-phosphate mannosyltransferase